MWIAGESDPIIRPVDSSQPLLTLRAGAPHVHISNVRLLGGLKVEGGDLELTDCSIEPNDRADQQGGGTDRRLTSAAAERPLSIDGGSVTLTRAVLTGHAAGAIMSAQAARLIIVASSLQGNHAQFGGAIRVSQGSIARLERCNLFDNTADESGGALQVRHAHKITHTHRDCGEAHTSQTPL